MAISCYVKLDFLRRHVGTVLNVAGENDRGNNRFCSMNAWLGEEVFFSEEHRHNYTLRHITRDFY